jgi:FKBP-type peptidyl-prolyl cis-trans isomerase FklB
MKLFMAAAMGVLLAASTVLADDKGSASADPGLKDLKQKVSYGMGFDMGTKLKAQSIDIDPDLLARGFKDALSGKAAMSEQEIRTAMMAYIQELNAKKKTYNDNFLIENKKKPGVVTLPSGLQYQVITQGNGKSPKATDTVTTNYEGKLVDGTVFDSSYKRGEPASFPVNGVIKGWTEALQLMKVGSKWKLFIPSDLAYGPQGRPPVIGPNAVLVFDIELLDVK